MVVFGLLMCKTIPPKIPPPYTLNVCCDVVDSSCKVLTLRVL